MVREDEEPRHFKMSLVPDPPQPAPELRRLAHAGNGLIATGIAGLLLNCVMTIGSLLFAPMKPPGVLRDLEIRGRAIDHAAADRGRDAAPLVQTCVIALPTMMVYPLAIVGGVRMKQVRSYGLSVTSAILVTLPCSCAFLLGLPVGIWALTLLTDPRVRNKFQ